MQALLAEIFENFEFSLPDEKLAIRRVRHCVDVSTHVERAQLGSGVCLLNDDRAVVASGGQMATGIGLDVIKPSSEGSSVYDLVNTRNAARAAPLLGKTRMQVVSSIHSRPIG